MLDIPTPIILSANSSNTLECTVVDNVTGLPINNGTATIRIIGGDGAEISGHDWPELLQYVPGTEGLYRVVIDKTGIPAPGSYSEGIFVFIDANGYEKECTFPIEVRKCDGIS